MILPGFTGSSPVSISVEPTAARSAIALSSAHRLKLLPLFNRFGHYVCDIPLSIPTRSGFYTSKISLECSHEPGTAEIILGLDWCSACTPVLCNNGTELEDPAPAITSCLPAGHYWSPSNHWGRGDLETSGKILGKLWALDHFSPNVSTNRILGIFRL